VVVDMAELVDQVTQLFWVEQIVVQVVVLMLMVMLGKMVLMGWL
jgi:hypothetical protein